MPLPTFKEFQKQVNNTTKPNSTSRFPSFSEFQKTQPIIESKPTILEKVGGFAKELAKDAASTLLVKPAARATEAITRVVAPNSLATKGYESMGDEGQLQTFKAPVLGDINVAPIKAFGQGGGKQIVGEALKSAAYLAPYGKVSEIIGGAATPLVAKLGSKAIIPTSKLAGEVASGILGGSAFGAGGAMEEGLGTKDIFKQTAIGGALGGVAPLAISGLSRLFKPKIKVPSTGATEIPITEVVSKVETPKLIKPTPKSQIEIRASNSLSKEDFIKNEIEFLNKTKQKVTPSFSDDKLGKIWDKMNTAVEEKLPKSKRIINGEPVVEKTTPISKSTKQIKQITEEEASHFDDMFDEATTDADRMYKKSTVQNWVNKAEELKSTKTNDEIIDIIQKRPGTQPIEGLPNEALRKVLLRDKTLTDAQKYRLKNTLSGSESGAELRAMQIDKNGRITNEFDYVKSVEAKMREKLNNAKVTKTTISRFLDDIECK